MVRHACSVSNAVLATLLVVASAGASADASDTRSCGDTTVALRHGFEGGAWKIRATHVSCERARSVATACVHGHHAGWTRSSNEARIAGVTHVRTLLARDRARVSFEIVGGGGCA
jgi:hypothetical protein